MNRTQQTTESPRWTSHRGDEWWYDDASANFGCGNFTIVSFGKHAGYTYALQLIKDALDRIPDTTVDVLLDDENRKIIDQLVRRGLIEKTELELSTKTTVARIERIL